MREKHGDSQHLSSELIRNFKIKIGEEDIKWIKPNYNEGNKMLKQASKPSAVSLNTLKDFYLDQKAPILKNKMESLPMILSSDPSISEPVMLANINGKSVSYQYM